MSRVPAALLGALLAAAVPARAQWNSGLETIKLLQKQFNQGRYNEVIAQLDSASLLKLRDENLRVGYVLLGASYEKTGQLDQSLSFYQVGVRLFPRDKDLLARLAALLHQAGLEEQAQPLFEKLVLIDPHNAQGHLGLAQIDRALGFLDRSSVHYEKTLETWPERGDIWQEYGEELGEARDYRTAELALRRALALAPEKTDIILDLALVLRAMGRTDEALTELAEPVRSGRPGALRARALWLLEEGRGEESKAAVEALSSVAPKDPVALYVRARLELKAGRLAQAQGFLRQAAAASPEASFTARVCAALAAWAGRQR